MHKIIFLIVILLMTITPQKAGAHMTTKVEYSGHRGTMVGAPENTIAAFEYAAKNGMDWVEFDIQWTKDGKMVVMHDWTVDRTTNGTGPVSNYTLVEIKKLDAGSYFGDKWKGEQIPTFEEVIAFCKKHGLKMNAEIKTKTTITAAQAKQYIRALESAGMSGKNVMSSTSKPAIRKIQKYAPKMKTALISKVNPGKRVIVSYGDAFMPTWDNFKLKNVDSIRRVGILTFIWPVRNKDDFDKARATEAGVIVVDDPAAVKGWI